jgi:hypothetical protein
MACRQSFNSGKNRGATTSTIAFGLDFNKRTILPPTIRVLRLWFKRLFHSYKKPGCAVILNSAFGISYHFSDNYSWRTQTFAATTGCAAKYTVDTALSEECILKNAKLSFV